MGVAGYVGSGYKEVNSTNVVSGHLRLHRHSAAVGAATFRLNFFFITDSSYAIKVQLSIKKY